MRKLMVISIILSSVAIAQNDGLVKTNYGSGALQTEGTIPVVSGTDSGHFGTRVRYFKITVKTMNPTPRTQAKAMAYGIPLRRLP